MKFRLDQDPSNGALCLSRRPGLAPKHNVVIETSELAEHQAMYKSPMWEVPKAMNSHLLGDVMQDSKRKWLWFRLVFSKARYLVPRNRSVDMCGYHVSKLESLDSGFLTKEKIRLMLGADMTTRSAAAEDGSE